MTNYKEYIALIKRMSGQANLISVPRVYIDLCGNLEYAAVLSQSVYWSDKTDDPDGWFYKSHREWKDEIGITRYSLDAAQSNLVGMGVLKTKVARAGKTGAPTTHYKIDDAVLADRLVDLLGGFAENGKSDLLKTANQSAETDESSITEITTKSNGDPAYLISVIDTYLHQKWDGTYNQVQPVISISELPNVIKIGVSIDQPALRAEIASLIKPYTRKKYAVKVIHTQPVVSAADLTAKQQARIPHKRAYEEVRGGPCMWEEKDDNHIDWLMENGCTTDHLKSEYRRNAKDPYWTGKAVPISVVAKNYLPTKQTQPATTEVYYT